MCHLLEGKLAPAESHLIHSGGKKKNWGVGWGKTDREEPPGSAITESGLSSYGHCRQFNTNILGCGKKGNFIERKQLSCNIV